MLDPLRFAAAQLARLYRQRWEIELGFREIKQSLRQGQGVAAQQAARTGQARGLGRVDRLYPVATVDAPEGPACRCRAYPYQLPHSAARHRGRDQYGAPCALWHLARAPAAAAEASPLLRAPASSRRAILPA
ncbi:transposase [Ottowia sp.]|uniref:transposase n=1 Tax=Ottowia sp. TaxID=1898956 RepID=UPI00345470B2